MRRQSGGCDGKQKEVLPDKPGTNKTINGDYRFLFTESFASFPN